MSREEAVEREAQRCEMFAEMAEHSTSTEDRLRYARKSHYAHLAMIRLEGTS